MKCVDEKLSFVFAYRIDKKTTNFLVMCNCCGFAQFVFRLMLKWMTYSWFLYDGFVCEQDQRSKTKSMSPLKPDNNFAYCRCLKATLLPKIKLKPYIFQLI